MKRLMALSMIVPLCGCSLFAGSTQTVTVSCEDPEAELFVNGLRVGKGRVTTVVQRDATSTFTARKGSEVGTMVLGNRLSTTGVLDIIGGIIFLLPLIGLVSPGSRALEREEVIIVMPSGTSVSK